MPDNLFHSHPFFIEWGKNTLCGDFFLEKKDDVPDILFLHDADRASDHTVFKTVRQLLVQQYHLSSCAFDFIGHGSTTNEWSCSTLEQRTKQALEVVDGCFDCQPLSIVALGIGAHTAIKMLPKCDVSNLVLLMPALYHPDAYTTTFFELFGHQHPDSMNDWEQSEVCHVMEGFQGRLCLATDSSDDTVSGQVTNLLGRCALTARSYSTVDIPCRPDTLMDFVNQQPNALSNLVSAIADTCSSTG